jgi:large repetitive protein
MRRGIRRLGVLLLLIHAVSAATGSAASAAVTLDLSGCGPASTQFDSILPPFETRAAPCDVLFGDSVDQATLRMYQQDGAGAAMPGIADYDPGVADWDVGSSAFGACLENLTGGTAVWTEASDGDCSTTVADTWNPVSPTSTGSAMATSAPGLNQTASVRFGLRAEPTVAAGAYNAVLVMEVLATNVNTPPDAPALVTPADAALVPTTTPTLTATFTDPDAGDTGLVRFDVCSDPSCTTVVRTGTSAAGIASGSNGSWIVGAALSQGVQYYWRARNEDAAAATSGYSPIRTFTVNSTSVPTLNSPAASATITTTTPTLSANFNDPNVGHSGTINFRVTQTAACTSGGSTGTSAAGVAIGGPGTWTTPSLAPGVWYYCATSTDSAGLTSSLSLIRSFTVNSTSVPTLNSPAAGGTVTTATPILSADFQDPDPGQTGTINFRVTQTAACTSGGSTGSSAAGIAIGSPGTWTTPALAAGVWYYCATSTDSAGVTSGLSAIRSFTVNGTSVPTLNSPAAGATITTTTPTLSADFQDPNTGQTGTINFRVTQTAACTSGGSTGSSAAGIAIGSPGTWTTPALAAGVWYYCATSTDSAGVTSSLSLIRSFTLNGTSVPTLNSPAAGSTSASTTPTLSADFQDPNAGQTGTINFRVTQTAACTSGGFTGASAAGIAIGSPGTWTTPVLTPGAWYYCATSTDSAGITSSLSLIRGFIVNGTSVPTLNSPAAGATITTTTPTLSADFQDPDVGQTGTINFRVTQTAACTSGGSVGSSAAGIAIGTPGTWTTPALAAGLWYYCATSTDSAGVTSSLSSIRSFTVNGTSVPTLNNPAAGGTITTTTPTLSADFQDPNTGQTGTINFRVTQTPACTSGGSVGTSAAGIAIGSPGTWTTPALAPGVWFYCATSTDSAGITSSLSAIRSFTVNGTSVPTLNSPAAGGTVTSTTPTLSADFQDPDAGQTGTINFRVTQTAACTSGGSTGSSAAGVAIGSPGTWTTPALAVGVWYYCATSTDSAGVTSALSLIRSFTVNGTSAPTLNSPAASATITTTTPTLSADFQDPNPGHTGTINFRVTQTAACTSGGSVGSSAAGIAIGSPGTWTTPALAAGVWYYCATSTDSAGITSSLSTIRSFTVNGTSVPTLNSPAAGATTTDTTPTLSADFEDPNVGQTGTINFRVTQTAACTSGGSVGASAAGIAIGSPGTWTTPTLAAGVWYYCATSTDSAGVTSSLSAIRSFTVNTTSAPTLSSPADLSSTSDPTPVLSAVFNDSDAGQTGTISFRVTQTAACTSGGFTGSSAGGIAIGGTGNWTASSLTDGVWYFCATSTDSLGGVSALSAIRSFTVSSAPVVVGSGSGGGATNAVVNVPAGTQVGDLLVAGAGSDVLGTITPPAGWTQWGINGASGLRVVTYYRIVAGGDPTSYTWSMSGANVAAGMISLRSATTVGTTSSSFGAGPVTTFGMGARTLAANGISIPFACLRAPGTWAITTGWTVQWQRATGNVTCGMGTKFLAGGGTTGTATATISGAGGGGAYVYHHGQVAP